jgi:hypothetical protein
MHVHRLYIHIYVFLSLYLSVLLRVCVYPESIIPICFVMLVCLGLERPKWRQNVQQSSARTGAAQRTWPASETDLARAAASHRPGSAPCATGSDGFIQEEEDSKDDGSDSLWGIDDGNLPRSSSAGRLRQDKHVGARDLLRPVTAGPGSRRLLSTMPSLRPSSALESQRPPKMRPTSAESDASAASTQAATSRPISSISLRPESVLSSSFSSFSTFSVAAGKDKPLRPISAVPYSSRPDSAFSSASHQPDAAEGRYANVNGMSGMAPSLRAENAGPICKTMGSTNQNEEPRADLGVGLGSTITLKMMGQVLSLLAVLVQRLKY